MWVSFFQHIAIESVNFSYLIVCVVILKNERDKFTEIPNPKALSFTITMFRDDLEPLLAKYPNTVVCNRLQLPDVRNTNQHTHTHTQHRIVWFQTSDEFDFVSCRLIQFFIFRLFLWITFAMISMWLWRAVIYLQLPLRRTLKFAFKFVMAEGSLSLYIDSLLLFSHSLSFFEHLSHQ